VAADGEGTGSGTARAWIQRYLDAWNARDVDAVMGFLDEDVVFADVPLGAVARGAAEMRDFVARILTAYSSDFHRELGPVVVADERSYAFEFSEKGTNDLAPAASRFPATGRQFSLAAVSIGRLRNGRIVEHKDYWDLAGYLQQVGLLPAPGGE
jgi:steroid delta-isomerase-like uncharacterized protein